MTLARLDRFHLARVPSVLLAGALLALLSGCAGLGYRDAGETLETFAALPDNAQVRYAPGAESFARQVAAILPAATAQVEAMQHRRFRRPPVVYVCDDDDCFHRFVAAGWNYTAAVVYDNRLLLASRLFDREPHRLKPILLHELSHLHLGQFRGHYTMAIPVWFHEGLASLVASGGGADLVTDADAYEAAGNGRHFLADEQHLPWRRTRADAWDIPISLFYRQAMLYLDHLRSRDEAAFRRLIRALQDGADFDAAFAQTYQANPGHSVRAYFHSAARIQGALP
ncbi:MAG: hypothetical protein EHM59_12695 [Betaproteobacteria bacterium]|nr:MAG: hypothetical protein EHM59_12695 [Betaproteobacteria bacterium]